MSPKDIAISTMKERWPNLRRECYQRVRGVIQAEDHARPRLVYELQCSVMQAIIEAEESGADIDPQQIKRHIHLLRLCIDSLAFVLLHPHTIRQLGKNSGSPPRLSGQREACDEALAVAKEYADNDAVALVSDLSNLLRVSDVVVCDDIETPTLIECKGRIPSPDRMKVDRPGRQLSRAMGALQYISEGAGWVIGEKVPRLSVNSTVLRKKSQDAIERVIADARNKGSSYEFVSPSDLIICIQPNAATNTIEIEPFMHLTSDFRQALMSSYACAMWNPSLLIPPAIIWNLEFDDAVALMEEELSLIHVIDVMRFCDLGDDDFRITGIIVDEQDARGRRIETMSSRGTGTANISFVFDALYWFYTIESSFDAIKELHELYVEAIDSREYERAKRIDVEKVAIKQTKIGGDTVLNVNGPGSYRMRARCGDEFVAGRPDDPNSSDPEK